MNTYIKYLIFVLIILLNTTAAYPENCVSPYAVEPSAEDIYFLELINRARANPSDEATMYNIDLNEGLPSGTLTNTPRQPLAFNLKLYQAALSHSQDMITRNFFSHYTEGTGESPSDRCYDHGYYEYSGENIALNMSTRPFEISQSVAAFHHELLFVDENYPGRGHRVNLLNASHVEAGVAMASGSYNNYPSAASSTSDFGRGESPSYICGVIYDDKNENNFYDIDEGIPFSTIRILESGESVAGYAAGAYSLATSARGEVTVEAYLCSSNAVATKSVYIGDENIKVDFLSSDFDNNTPIDPPDNSHCESLSIAEIVIPDDAASIKDAPVSMLSSASIPFSDMMAVDAGITFPCYTTAVDLYAAIQFPDGRMAFIDDTGSLTPEFKAFAVNTTTATGYHTVSMELPQGLYFVYWLVVPTNGGDLFRADLTGYFELGLYTYRL